MKSETEKTNSENICIINGFARPLEFLYSGLMGDDGKSLYRPVAPQRARIIWKSGAVIATYSADVETMDAIQRRTIILSECLGFGIDRSCCGLGPNDDVSFIRFHSGKTWQHKGYQPGGDMEGCTGPAKAEGEGKVPRCVRQPQAQKRVRRLQSARLLREPLGPRPWLQEEPEASDEQDAVFPEEKLNHSMI